jgi:hypothetical protein
MITKNLDQNVMERSPALPVPETPAQEVTVRQGEWVFLPVRGLALKTESILWDQPLRLEERDSPQVDFLYRDEGSRRFVCDEYPYGLSEPVFNRLIRDAPEQGNFRWQSYSVNPRVYVKGRVRREGFGTLVLTQWHRTEIDAAAI